MLEAVINDRAQSSCRMLEIWEVQPQRITVLNPQHIANSLCSNDLDLDGRVACDFRKDNSTIDLTFDRDRVAPCVAIVRTIIRVVDPNARCALETLPNLH